MKKLGKILLVFIVCISLLTSCANVTVSSTDSTESTTSSTQNVSGSVSREVVSVYNEKSNQVSSSVEDAVEAVYDSVVVINAYVSNGYSSGSGVIIGESDTYSYVVTCHHVIEDANNYEVILSDQSTYNGVLVGGDPDTDIAVLRIEATGLVVSSFISDSETIKLGSTAIAIGNPLGILANTVTVGVVSAVNREITMSDGTSEVLIQTDAAINSGNSGGGLFNISGELIGIVSSKYSSSGVEGLGFAVPANTVRTVVTELINNGYVTGRYSLGITIAEGYTRSSFWGQATYVVYVYSVDELGSAYQCLKSNDIITKISVDYLDESKSDVEITITSLSDATNILNSEFSIGDKITFTITRNGSSETVEVTLKQYIYR